MISVIKKIVQTSRLGEYQAILEIALAEGYKITSLKDWYEHGFYPDQNVLVLRHDVDYDNEGAYKMYEIEKRLGVNSTFYYRWSTIHVSTMEEINENGFEVSLHFETLATYCREKNICSGQELTTEDFDICFEKLLDEIRVFQEKFWDIKTICSHGDQRNRLIGIPNHRILEGKDREELGLFFETYDEPIKSKFDAYISDSSIKSNHGWRYGLSPEEAIKQKKKNICLLTHPQHWNYHLSRNIKKVVTDIYEHFFRS
ncbi:hypothetical protein [Gracilimonas sp.]|uniref:hypothetical protein n=1 Tax=Gracilimonas sp. TaxID=1974203 RepID=UPI0032EE31CC